MTADEVARELRMSVYQVYRLAREGKLPSVRYGRWVRFHRRTIENMLAGGTSQASESPDKNDLDSLASVDNLREN